MSVFSVLKRGRQAAKEHAAKQAEKEKLEQAKTPYKHVPKHAGVDALSSGPATWRDADRPKILEQNRRRSAMTASGINMGSMGGMSTPVHMGMPRVNSALSHVSYPSTYASPVVQIPRAYSYTSPTPGWSYRGGETSYAPLDAGSVSFKGKEVERVMVDSGRASRSSSSGSAGLSHQNGSQSSRDVAVSPVGSSSNSTSSGDDLEMRPVKHAVSSHANANATTSTRRTSDTESFHRLHPGHARRMSDSHQQAAQQAAPLRNTRPFISSRESSRASLAEVGIPPVPAIPAMQFGTALSSSIAASSASSIASSMTVVPGSSSASFSTKIPAPVPVPIPSPAAEERSESRAMGVYPVGNGVTTTQPSTQNNRRVSKITRFSELETINSNITASVETPGPKLKERQEKTRPHSTITALPNTFDLPTTFDEASLPAHQQQVLPPSRTGKLSKNAPTAKLAKKNRWSLRSSKTPATVAF
ncbi:hypothetical protein B0H66DRAFT_603002 [Apodospora peruviana]|uniref:Uncharacterized protein n=1 Tax=Apodospora peruviana TaxID=516989 RepID=A0AAE0I4H2_9PEZI|nr:hypothetical protein B0H66DRAFT_603002 [Apodospora peruviana]